MLPVGSHAAEAIAEEVLREGIRRAQGAIAGRLTSLDARESPRVHFLE